MREFPTVYVLEIKNNAGTLYPKPAYNEWRVVSGFYHMEDLKEYLDSLENEFDIRFTKIQVK